MAAPLDADYLKNGDLKDGTSCWQGDGVATNLKPDGTEGSDTDTDSVPVLKLSLESGQAHVVTQDLDMPDQPTHFRVHVDVYASKDFKRSQNLDDYSIFMRGWPSGALMQFYLEQVPKTDFWIQIDNAGHWFYKITNLKPGGWTSLTADYRGLAPANQRTVGFHVPPGTGTVYIRNMSAGP